MNEPHDDLADWLAPRPPGDGAEFRAAVLRRTGHVLLWRRCARRAGRAAVLAVMFLAGGALVWWAAPRTVVVREVVVAPPASGGHQPPESSQSQGADAPRSPEPTAHQLEDEADRLQARRAAAHRFRAAGDRYAAAGDYESALRCYKQALDNGSADDLMVSPDDNWLLMTLKADRRGGQEKPDASPDS